ncbi:MAG: hypothetical protein DRN15_07275 [Thermoprotei archaeon]|nr:MAG: hypothetical protein DRN15_07275 [Thermoprotei archaeon]
MGGVLEKLLEKARKEPEKYKDLLLEEKHSLEADLRHYFTWILTLLGLEIAYVSIMVKLRLGYVSIIAIMFMVSCVIHLAGLYIKKTRILRVLREMLYGDPMDEYDTYFIIMVTIMSIILAILAIIL